MEINLLQSEGLTRAFCIRVPQAVLNERFDQCMKELRPQLNLRGFRPGKVPLGHAKRVCGPAVMKDVVDEYKKSANEQALINNNFKPATLFDNQDECDMEEVFAGNADLHYHAICEILPTFKPAEIASLDLKKTVFKCDDKFLEVYVEASIADMLGEKIERGEDEVVQTGDTVEFDFSISADGTPIEELQMQTQRVIAGEVQGLFNLSEHVVGLKVGERKTIEKKYPENFMFPQMANKISEIHLTVTKIEYVSYKPYDETAAIEIYGEADLPQIKEDLVTNLKTYLSKSEEEELKVSILDALEISHDFLLPEGMVVQEHKTIMEQLQSEMRAGNLADEDYLKTTAELDQEYRKIAERRVRLGLVLAEIGRIDNIEVTENEVFAYHIYQQNLNREQVDQMVKVARENKLVMSQLRAPIYEDRVVEHILKLAKVEEVGVDIATVVADRNHKYYSTIQSFVPHSLSINNSRVTTN